MKLEMKSIKHSDFASQGTPCYEGHVYIDGKKSIHVSNDGRGGSDRYHSFNKIPYSIIREVDEWCKKNLPKWKMSSDGDAPKEYDTDFESWCHTQVHLWLRSKELKRVLNKCVIFVENDELMECRYKVKKLSGVHINHFKINNKDVKVILNDMPFDKALKTYNDYLDFDKVVS